MALNPVIEKWIPVFGKQRTTDYLGRSLYQRMGVSRGLEGLLHRFRKPVVWNPTENRFSVGFQEPTRHLFPADRPSLANEKMTRVDSVTLDERGEGTSQQQRQVRNILYVETIGNDGMEGRLNS